ncbi:hypothetical protein C8J57DRAFT_1718962 [Mycena rebaudengoi]|nr:hypothetical protein C8J57DRAFT_1718962 [Mycena rebaudengoi]
MADPQPPHRGHDNPGPSLILTSSRTRKPVKDAHNAEVSEALVDRIDALTCSLSATVKKASRDDRIYDVITRILGIDPTVTGTFNRRMDLLFGKDCCNKFGRLNLVRSGPFGMAMVVKYFQGLEWGQIEADATTIKLQRIIDELTILCNSPGKSSTPSTSKRRSSGNISDPEDTT